MDLTDLYERWHGRVLSLARSLVSPAEADEVAQDVFLEVWRRMPAYDPARAGVWTWIHSIARSRCLDRLRTNHVRSRALLRAAEVVEHEAPDEGWESRDRVEKLLGRLSPRQRRVVELAYFDGLTHREIALRTRDPLGTVKTRLRLALNVLRQATVPDDVRKAPAAAKQPA